MLLKARWVVPVSSPPIENGVVVVDHDRIVFVGAQFIAPKGRDESRPYMTIDLGNITLLPGLVNAHTHLEFSHLLGRVAPDRGFTDWARKMAAAGPSGRDALTNEFRRLLETGTTTVADHCNPETPPFEAPFRRLLFWEVLGADRERAAESFERAKKRAATEGGFPTPHSLYAVHPEILRRMRDLPRQSIHFLESADEDRFLRRGDGPLADYVRERGGHVGRNELRPYTLAPLQLAPGTLLIHGNYIRNEEFRLLKNREVALVHCPGSHRFFGHQKFPLEECRKNGIPIALGTDSPASNKALSMLREMRLLRESYPEVGDDEILRMATLGGAETLKMEQEIGSIEVGKKADLIAVAGNDVLKAERVVFSMIDGKVMLEH